MFAPPERLAGRLATPSAAMWRHIARRTLLLAIVIAPSAAIFPIPGYLGDWTTEPYLRFVDPLLFVVAVLRFAAVARKTASTFRLGRQMGASGLAWSGFALFVGWSVLSAVVHPQPNAFVFAARLVSALAVVEFLSSSTQTERNAVVKTMGALTVLNAVICVAQYVGNGPVGLGAFGELDDPFQRTATWRAPISFSYYPYPLSSIALLSLAATLWMVDRKLVPTWFALLVGAAAGVQIGCGYSLTAAVTAAIMIVVFIVRTCPRGVKRWTGPGAASLAVFVGAVAITATVLSDGWQWKGERSASTDLAVASSGRSGQIKVGLEMIKRWPLTGIGPGSFSGVRQAFPEFNKVSADTQIVHSFPVLVAAESGVPALIALAIGVLAVMWRRWRMSAVLLVSVSGYAAADLMYWYSGFGILQIALWFGLLLAVREYEGDSLK
jgi:O-Antigen ligase